MLFIKVLADFFKQHVQLETFRDESNTSTVQLQLSFALFGIEMGPKLGIQNYFKWSEDRQACILAECFSRERTRGKTLPEKERMLGCISQNFALLGPKWPRLSKGGQVIGSFIQCADCSQTVQRLFEDCSKTV